MSRGKINYIMRIHKGRKLVYPADILLYSYAIKLRTPKLFEKLKIK